jgi:chromosome partitioning protein
MKVITVTGYKGGVAKSTTAVHLAACFAKLGNTLLVDVDPNHTAIDWDARTPAGLPFDVVSQHNAIRASAGRDFIVFDTPARPDSGDLAELVKACDLLILPTSPDTVSMLPMLDVANSVGKASPYRVVVTLAPPAPSKAGTGVRDHLVTAGYPVCSTIIKRNVNFVHAADLGVLVRDISGPRAQAAWGEYCRLSEEIMEVLK